MQDNRWFIVNVEAAIYKDNRWLIIKRSMKESNAPGAFAFVGGKIEGRKEMNGVVEKALEREIFEEVGVEVEDIKYIHSSLFISDNDHPVINITFKCKYKSGEPTVKNYDEVEKIIWLTKEEILDSPEVISHTKEVVLLI